MVPEELSVWQAKKTYPVDTSDAAVEFLHSTMGVHIGEPIVERCEFTFTPSPMKTSGLTIPVDLARYALMYYVSSLARAYVRTGWLPNMRRLLPKQTLSDR